MRDSKGRFIKGSPGFNRKHSEETKRKLSELQTGKKTGPRYINGIVDDNRIENLMLFSSNKEHMKHHHRKEDK